MIFSPPVLITDQMSCLLAKDRFFFIYFLYYIVYFVNFVIFAERRALIFFKFVFCSVNPSSSSIA